MILNKIIKIVFKSVFVIIFSPVLFLYLIIDLGTEGLDYREWMVYDLLKWN